MRKPGEIIGNEALEKLASEGYVVVPEVPTAEMLSNCNWYDYDDMCPWESRGAQHEFGAYVAMVRFFSHDS